MLLVDDRALSQVSLKKMLRNTTLYNPLILKISLSHLPTNNYYFFVTNTSLL